MMKLVEVQLKKPFLLGSSKDPNRQFKAAAGSYLTVFSDLTQYLVDLSQKGGIAFGKAYDLGLNPWPTRGTMVLINHFQAIGDAVCAGKFIEAYLDKFPDLTIRMVGETSTLECTPDHARLKKIPFLLPVQEAQNAIFRSCEDLIDGLNLKNEAPSLEAFFEEKYQVQCRKPAVQKHSGKVLKLFPISTSPLRTLHPNLLAKLCNLFERTVAIEVHLGAKSQHSQDYVSQMQTTLERPVKFLQKKEHLKDLKKRMQEDYYGVFCDSGPAHLTKFYGTAGTVFHNVANGETHMKGYNHLQVIQADFSSAWCNSPCGLSSLFLKNEREGCFATHQTTTIGERQKRPSGSPWLLENGEMPPCHNSFIEQFDRLVTHFEETRK